MPEVICVIHLPPLPGSPESTMEVEEIVEFAVKNAKAIEEGNADGIIVENYGDRPFLKRVGAETIASMAVVAREVRKESNLKLGINVLRNDAIASAAIAKAVNADFIRVNQLFYSSLSPEGWLEACSAELMRYRHFIKGNFLVFADVNVKHSCHFVDLADYAENFERSLADAAIVTGKATGKAVELEELKFFRERIKKPVYAGSGVTPSIAEVIGRKNLADGIIVGTYIKDGEIVNPEKVRKIVGAFKCWR